MMNPATAALPGKEMFSSENAGPARIPAAPSENPVETNEFSDSAQAAEVGDEPDRIQAQPAEHQAANDQHDELGAAHELVTWNSETASPSIAHSEIPPDPNHRVVGGGLAELKNDHTKLSTAALENPPRASSGVTAHQDDGARHLANAAESFSAIRESNAALSQILGDLVAETRQAAAAHGDSLRAIHGAIQELRCAHQEISSRLNQPQGQ